MPKGAKRTREGEDDLVKRKKKTRENDWKEIYDALKKTKDDYLVEYYMEPAAGGAITQADRDYVAQVIYYYSPRSKRDTCPPIATVTAGLADAQGFTTNHTAQDPIGCVFMAAKHINAMYHYLQANRGDHNNFVVHIRVDNSAYAQI
jgi:hypothetical protein